jgi:serine/threonine-protein kinase
VQVTDGTGDAHRLVDNSAELLRNRSSPPAEAGPTEAPSGAEKRVDEGGWDSREAVRAAANRELSAGLLETGVHRLSGIATVASVVFAAYAALYGALAPRSDPEWDNTLGVLVAGLVLSLGAQAVTRVERLRPQVITDAGYLYLILLCLLLAVLRYAHPFLHTELVRQVSPAVLPILSFGALIPAPPTKALVVSLAAAATDPLVLFINGSQGSVAPAQQTIFLVASPFVAALLAYGLSRVTHRLRAGIAKALEVGSYRLVERLGVGGMAEVWRADHQMLARPAAVKLIRPKVLVDHGPADSERLLRLFAREAQATASLKSPHTVQIYDFGITREGAFYHVMELLEGVDLQTLVERFGPQPAERVAAMLRQACHSLHEAHCQQFVHRDVKPANIFTCHYGEDYDFVKVLDFGLVLDRHPTQEELEDEKRFVGTPAVMAPEMVRYQAPVDARADVYALGCVGYWLLSGKRVFEATTRHDMLVMHAHQKPLTPSKRLGSPVHPGLEAVIMSCLEKNPNKRPQTMRELSESLGALEFAEPWTEERATLWWKTQKPTDGR